MLWVRMLGFAVAAPIFLAPLAMQLAPRNLMGDKEGYGFVIPLSTALFPVFALVVGWSLIHAKGRWLWQDSLVGILVALAAMSFLVGTINDPKHLGLRAIYWLQTTIALSWYFIGRIICLASTAAAARDKYASLLKTVCGVTILFLAGYVVQTVIGTDGSKYSMIADHIGPFYNFKIQKFWSVALVIASCVFLAFYMFTPRGHPRFAVSCALIGFLASSLCIVMLWARSGILAWLIGTVMVAVVGWFSTAANKKTASTKGALVIVVLCVAGALVVAGELIGATRFARTIEQIAAADLSASDANRLDTMENAIEATISSPLGALFELVQRRDGLKPHGSESGILDLSVRTGPAAWLVLPFFAYLAISGCMRQARFALHDSVWIWAASAGCAVALLLAFSVFLTVPLEPYGAAIMWSLLGAMAGASCFPRNHTSSGRVPDGVDHHH